MPGNPNRPHGRVIFIAALLIGFIVPLPSALARASNRTIRPLMVVPASAPDASVEVDPGFAYYKNRSDDSIAAEIAAHGYKVVRYEVTADCDIRRSLVDAYHRAGLKVWYTTFVNGVYSTKDLPTGWEKWKMVTRSDLAGKPESGGFQYLCPNDPGYRAWKKKEVVSVLRHYPFDGIDLKEPYWPDYPGPQSPTYACFCSDCRSEFAHEFPGSPVPDILNPSSPTSPKNDPMLWRKWLQFRRDSLAGDLDDIINGPGGIRQVCPKVKIAVWGLAISGPDGIREIRDDNGEDAVQLARVLHPDCLCLETDWPDWGQPNLPANYVRGYKPFLDSIRRAGYTLPVFIEADLGSNRTDRRGNAWIAGFETACGETGFAPPALYEYSIGQTFYTDPPAVLAATPCRNGVTLVFSKRVDPKSADPSHFQLSAGRLESATVDGASVSLKISGQRPGERYQLTVSRISDMPSLRIYGGSPATVSASQTLDLRSPA